MEDKLPLVYAMNHARNRFACQYYRLDVPLESFEKMRYAHCWNDIADNSMESTIEGMTMADYDLFWGLYSEAHYYQLQDLKSIQPATDDKGILHFPPVMIKDVDDNRDYIHPDNTAFCTQGVRGYTEGKYTLLSPGTKLCSRDPHTDEEIVKWEDGVTFQGGSVFDISRNLRDMHYCHKICALVDGMTCTSPLLAKYLKEVVGVKHVHVFPNTIVPEHYESFPLVRKDKSVRILWQGGCSHTIDWYPLRNAIKEISNKYPNIKFVIFGHLDRWVQDYIPSDKIEFHGWVDYSAYKLKRALLQVDINLCPLADNIFNRCKSAIKWYEGSVWDIPEATLAADVPPYNAEMQDGVTGLLYKNPADFVYKLSELIEKPEFRTVLGQNAKEWVLTNRVPQATIPPLWEFYEGLKARQVGEYMISQNISQAEIKRLAGITQ